MHENILKLAALQERGPAPGSEDAIALAFAADHATTLRYVALWAQWLRWDGTRWAQDTTLHVFDLVRDWCRDAGLECGKQASAKLVAAVHTLARADRRLAATADQWDADTMLLNGPAGVVDLVTGELRPHDHEDYMTKAAAVSPRGDCPLWLSFLADITARNTELQAFLQRMCGYALTGDIGEHALFFGYGTGANGKTVFADTVAGILGDYHTAAPIETFTATKVDRHPTELADLRGARLVTAVETEDGRRWAESRIKMLTGGETVRARFMRENFFSYRPQFKLLVTGNHKPGLRSVDEAMRRRLNLIPFAVTIPPDKRDRDLASKLTAEWPGILAWMIQGCLAWQRAGLRPPESVRAATAAYLENEDAARTWIDDCCKADPQAWTKTSELFASWKEWAERAGEHVGSQKRFTQGLEDRGYPAHRTSKGRGHTGLKVVA